MQGLSFQVQKPISSGSPNRMDIACFVGLVDVRKDAVREDINHWLYEQSWLNPDQDYEPEDELNYLLKLNEYHGIFH